MPRMRRVLAVVLFLAAVVPVAVSTAGCGGRPPVPRRLVVEKDLEGWKYRRFQGPVVCVRVWGEGNKGEGARPCFPPLWGRVPQRG